VVLATLVALTVVGLCFARLFFGVDWTDEAFYAAIPYRFVLGDRPFIDELNIVQTAGLLEYPFVRVYVAVFSSEGLILALRMAYLLFVAGIGALAFILLRRVVRWPYLLGGGLAYMCIVFLSIPTLSYNTLSAGFLTYGVLFGLGHLVAERGRWSLVASGCCLGLAGVAYVPLLAVGPVFAAGMWLAASGGRRRTTADAPSTRVGLRSALWYGVGLAAVLALFGALVLIFGVQHFLDAIAYTRSLSSFGGGAGKLRWLAVDATRLVTAGLPLTILLVVGALLAGRRRRGLRDLLIALVPATGILLVVMAQLRDPLVALVPATGALLPVWGQYAPVFASKLAILFAVYTWLVVCLQLERSSPRWTLFWWGLVPATAAGAITGYTSSNGLINAAVGLAPLLILGPVAASFSEDQDLAEARPAARSRRLVLPIASAIVLGLAFHWGAVYRDASIWHLTTRVSTGPYAGMLTTADRARLSSQLSRDLGKLSTPSDTVAFYSDFSAGYLFSRMRPCIETVWTTKGTRDVLGTDRRKRCLPSLIVRMWPSTWESLADGLPGLQESERYQLVRMRDAYGVYRLTGQGGN